MLVLKRRRGESILIGGEIEIVLLRVEKGTASIGIKAPDEVEIDRSELVARAGKTRRFRPKRAGKRARAQQ